MDVKEELTSSLSEVHCPNCEKIVNINELPQHCQDDIDRLQQSQRKTRSMTAAEQNTVTEAAKAAGDETENETTPKKPRIVFLKVQKNRQARQRQRIRRRHNTPPPEFPCPLCNVKFSQNDIQQHVDQCLRHSATNGNTTNGQYDTSSDDNDDSDEFEEYEWAGQKRVRLPSLLESGYATRLNNSHRIRGNHNSTGGSGSGSGSGSANGSGSGNRLGQQQTDEDDEDLNVDEDDTKIYGPAQYDESDVISPDIDSSNDDDDNNVTSYMRRLIGNAVATITTDRTATTETLTTNSSTSGTQQFAPDVAQNTRRLIENNNDATTSQNAEIPKTLAALTSSTTEEQNSEQIIESLKTKLKYYQTQAQSKYKCLICLDDYKTPAISVSCWHVHCEECWLRSLGARKLCPQCNLITSPKDLRKIYM